MKEFEGLVSRKTNYILFGIIALGVALRLYHIGFQSLWLDELYSIVPTDPKNSFASIIESSKKDQPPLFFIYLHYVFILFGYDELVGRLACAFLGILGVIAVYFLGKEIHSKEVGVFASFLASINYFDIYYSQELRFYTMAFLFSVLSFFYFIRAFKSGKRVDFFGYVLFTISLLYTHYYGIIIFCSQILTFIFLLTYKRDLKFIIHAVLSGVIIGTSFIPWIPIILMDSDVKGNWIKPPGPGFVAEYFYDYVGKDAGTTLILVVLLFLFFRSLKTSRAISDGRKPIYMILILWIVFSYSIPYIRSMTSAPLLHPRYTIVTLPAWFLLCAMGWDKIKNLNWKLAVPFLLAISFTVNMIFFKQHYNRVEKSQFREASEQVRSKNPSQYPIYSSLAWHYNFYFRNESNKVQFLDSSDLDAVKHFWLLQAHFSEEDMRVEVEKLNENFVVEEKYSFQGAYALLLKHK